MKKTTPLTAAERERLEKLALLPDDEIDLSDIPEISDEAWRNARRPYLDRPVENPVTICIDADVLAWFKEHAGGRGYQTAINRVLRRHVADAERRQAG